MNIVSPGDSLSGTANVRKCFDVDDHPVTLLVNEVAGNVFTGTAINRIGNQVRSTKVRGLFHIPTRQLIVTPTEGYNVRTLAMVCSYSADTSSDIDCKLVTDHMTKQCGSVGLERDRIGQLHEYM